MPAEVSVIIAAYNIGSYIERAIQSALDQEGISVEVIVVNDGSTDDTAVAISRISDTRVKRIDLKANEGPSVARNIGIDNATSPWIAILDGDDVFLPDRLMRCITRAKAMNADIVVDNLTIYRESDGSKYPMISQAIFSQLEILDIVRFINGNRSFLGNGEALGYLKPIIAAKILQRYTLRYDPQIRIGEDYLLLCEALYHGVLCAVEPTIGYLYTVRKGSISHRLTPADVMCIMDADKRFLSGHTLSPTAAQAQVRREYGLREAYAYTKLVDALKRGSVLDVLKAITLCPSATRHLWRPVWVRLERTFRHYPMPDVINSQ